MSRVVNIVCKSINVVAGIKQVRGWCIFIKIVDRFIAAIVYLKDCPLIVQTSSSQPIYGCC